MQVKRFLALLTACLLVCGLLAGCGGSASSAPAASTPAASTPAESAPADGGSGEQVTIQVATWDYSSNPSTSNAVAVFEKEHPEIHVEVVDIPSADYQTKLSVMLNGGDIDAYFIKEASSTLEYYDRGQLLDLNSYIAADGVDMSEYSGTDTPFNIDGKQLAMPVRTDYYVLYYNKDIFDAAGVDYPSNDMTWDEFEQLAMDLSGNGVYGAHFHTWQACVENWAVQDGEHTIMDYETGYDFFKPYYEMVLRLQDAGACQSFGDLQSGSIHYSGAFAAGNVAMLPMGTWYIATIAEAMKNGEANMEAWGVATLPHPANVEAGYSVGATTPIAITPSSKNQDAAWEFVKFMSSEASALEYAKVGAVPGRLSDEVLNQIASLDGMPEGLVEALQVKNIAPDRPIVPNVTEINTMLGQEHSLIMLGELSVDEGLAEMAERAAEIMG